MIWVDFIAYLLGFLVASAMFILNRHKGKTAFVFLFFVASGLLYVAIDAAYSVKEKFNPELHDCTDYSDRSCANLRWLGKKAIDECYFWGEMHNRAGDEKSRVFFKEKLDEWLNLSEYCVSWQPKKQQIKTKVIPQGCDIQYYYRNGTEAKILYVNESYKIFASSDCGFGTSNFSVIPDVNITASKNAGGLCPENTTYQPVTCDCAKNTNAPCMALCFECTPKEWEQKPIPETTSSLTIKLINSSDSITTWGWVQIIPCECCKTNTCLNLSNPKDLEELNVRQCGYAYRDYINRSVSESQRENAKEWLINKCNGIMTMGAADENEIVRTITNMTIFDGLDYTCINLTQRECLDKGINLTNSALDYLRNEKFCKDNPSDSERCDCVNWQSPDGNVSSASVVNCSQQEGELRIFSFSGKCVIMPSKLKKGFYYEPVTCVEAVPR